MTDPNVFIDHKKIEEALQAASIKALNVSLVGSSRLIRSRLSQAGKGRIYRIAQGKAKGARNLRAAGFHRASAPLDPPAANTNRLRGSWSVTGLNSSSDTFAAITKQPRGIILTFGSNVKYAPFLEFGTRRMTRRPYLKPSMPSIQKFSLGAFRIAIAEAFK